MKKLLSLLLVIIFTFALFACKANSPVKFTIEMMDGKTMSGELYPDVAPKTVDNFVKLCKEDYYAGFVFHRVISGFMIQAGGYTDSIYSGDFTEYSSADTIVGEFDTNGFENTLSHTRGVISMARTNEPNSASSQFFIMHQDNPSLDGNYAAFGKITEGLEVIDHIANQETIVINPLLTNVPKDAQVIKTIRIDE